MASVLLTLLLLLLARDGTAQVGQLRELTTDRVTVDAESIEYDEPTGTITATGDVVIRSGESQLQADRVRVNNATGEAAADGDVLLTGRDGVLEAREMNLNLEDETGTLVDATVRSLVHGYSLRGERVEKGLGQRYHIEEGVFTTCDCEEGAPSWSLSADEVDVDLNGYGHLRGGTFNVLDWPVLYVPRAIFPVSRERQSGLLLPHFGFSSRRGFQTILPMYFVIDRSQDATVAFDLETAARIGVLGEYRYALDRESEGQLNLSYFNELFRSDSDRDKEDSDIADADVPLNRWGVIGQHTQRLPYDGRGYVDLFLLSDDLFLREINNYTIDNDRDVLNRTRRYTKSRVAAVRTWDRAAARLEATYYEDLINDDDFALQEVPEVQVWGQKLLGGVAHATLDTTATAFQRRTGVDGLRVDLRPGLTVPIPTGLPLRAAVRVGFRETAYLLTEREMEGGFDPDSTGDFVLELPQTVSREIVELGGELSTELGRVYHIGGRQLQRLKHTIEPLLAYEYVPDVTQNDLPVFDDADRVNRRNLVTFGVRSRLFARFTGTGETAEEAGDSSIRELASVAVFQSYDVDRQIAPVGEPPGGTASDHFSDIDLHIRANPFESTSVLVRSNYDTSDGDLSSAAVALQFTDPRPSRRRARLASQTTATVAYRFITQNILQQVDASFLVHVTDNVGVQYATRYDVQNNELLENHFGLRLLSRCDCWALDLGFTDKTNPSEIELRAQLTLVGFGSSVSIGKGLQ